MKILIVDDHAATVTFMRLAFAGAGHAVTTASSVDEAVSCAASEPPDVVLSDLTFGQDREHDGCSLARSLRSMPETTNSALLAVSGADSPEVRHAASESGFDGFVSKPVDLPSLLDDVQRWGDRVAARRAGSATRHHT